MCDQDGMEVDSEGAGFLPDTPLEENKNEDFRLPAPVGAEFKRRDMTVFAEHAGLALVQPHGSDTEFFLLVPNDAPALFEMAQAFKKFIDQKYFTGPNAEIYKGEVSIHFYSRSQNTS